MERTDTTRQSSARYRPITRANFHKTPGWQRLNREEREAVEVVSTVLPFRTNEYVMNSLIHWGRVPDDPMFQLTFPQRGMLRDRDYQRVRALLRAEAPAAALEAEVKRVRARLNPHPAGQMTHNVPRLQGEPVPGIQHKYRETVLFFPSEGQTCHAYCTFCFRWAQFVGDRDLRFASREAEQLVAYLKAHPAVTDLLITGGDPMVMRTENLAAYVDAVLSDRPEGLHTLRIGTKSLAFWPHRFVTDSDADSLLRLFERVVNSGLNLSIMAHAGHPVEFSTAVVREAIRRIRSTGARIYMQAPLLRHINDDPDAWVGLWRSGVQLGCVPYYMFVERDTGAKNYFEVPLARAWQIFRRAFRQVSGMARTVRGPSMSAFPGKVLMDGVVHIAGQKAFALQYLQARRPELVRRPFFARFDPTATWFDQLVPLFESDRPFFETGSASRRPSSMVLGAPSGR